MSGSTTLIVFSYESSKRRAVYRTPPPPAPRMEWRPARNGVPGHNILVCCDGSDRKSDRDRDCYCSIM